MTANPTENQELIEQLQADFAEAIVACRIIDDVVKEGHDNLGKMVMHFLTAAEPARLALHKFNARQAAIDEVTSD